MRDKGLLFSTTGGGPTWTPMPVVGQEETPEITKRALELAEKQRLAGLTSLAAASKNRNGAVIPFLVSLFESMRRTEASDAAAIQLALLKEQLRIEGIYQRTLPENQQILAFLRRPEVAAAISHAVEETSHGPFIETVGDKDYKQSFNEIGGIFEGVDLRSARVALYDSPGEIFSSPKTIDALKAGHIMGSLHAHPALGADYFAWGKNGMSPDFSTFGPSSHDVSAFWLEENRTRLGSFHVIVSSDYVLLMKAEQPRGTITVLGASLPEVVGPPAPSSPALAPPRITTFPDGRVKRGK